MRGRARESEKGKQSERVGEKGDKEEKKKMNMKRMMKIEDRVFKSR